MTPLLVLLLAAALAAAAVAAAFAARLAADQARRTSSAAAAAELDGAVRTAVDGAVRTAVDAVLGLASDRLGQHVAAGAQHVELRSQAVQTQVAEIGAELRRVGELVHGLQRDRAEQHGQLVAGLAETARQSAQLADTAQRLREALASPKARGQWGERMAEDVLRLAGFAPGVSYVKQKGTAAGVIPDFTFLLPRGQHLHMDVKFPVDNYLRCLDAGADAERAAATAAQFLRDVRARVKELAVRDYTDPQTTVGFVLLFIPNEAVYSFIHEHDPALADVALAQKVVLCSPFTLFAVLGVVRQSVEAFLVERTSDEILACLGGFTKQWDLFTESIEGLGRKLDTTAKAYEELAGPRRRQLQRSLDRVEDLRARRGVAAEPAPELGDQASGGGDASVVTLAPPPAVQAGAEVRALGRRLTG